MKKQIVIIHGGGAFDSYAEYFSWLKSFKLDIDRFTQKGWKDSFSKKLGADFEVIQPEMPNSMNAHYPEWKIWFEKFIPFFQKEVLLIGHSLGGMFLAKYLSENKFSKRIRATFLIAAPFDDKDCRESLGDFALSKSLVKFAKQGGKIFLYQSKDDKSVPFVDVKKYQKEIPNAVLRIFANKGHFNQSEFPELVKDIKSLY